MPSKNDRIEWSHARRAETKYAAQLRKVARHIGDIIGGFDLEDEQGSQELSWALRRYADILAPWSRSVARLMLSEVKARTDKRWRDVSRQMGSAFRSIFEGPSDVGLRYRQLMDEQVELIRSIPLDAAKRVHDVTTEGLIKGTRFTEIAKRIQEGGQVSKSKATLIARTETGSAATALTQARSESVGSLGYLWRTMHDSDVRPSHKAMEGQFVRWDSPPTLDGFKGHAGACGPNDRCYPEPTFAIPGVPPTGRPRPQFVAEGV